ncbi:MAG: cupin domain-containing protein [Dehalococcoidales bacterium]|nr:MAG: cupin domain-containing protein [Dehalococcoidales bacterium]
MDNTKQTDKDLLAKVADIAGMVDYQDRAVVSRTIMDRQTGTVTLFSFDKGQGLSEHTAPFDALVHLLDGEAIVTISGNDHRLKAGEAIIMPANEPHALKAEERFKMMLVMIRDSS